MIPLRNEGQIKEYMVALKNNVTMLEANLICEKRQCNIVEKTTDWFIYKDSAKKIIKNICECAKMIEQNLNV